MSDPIAEGQDLLSQAQSVSSGDIGPLLGAATGLLADLLPADAGRIADDVAGVADAAGQGAVIGAEVAGFLGPLAPLGPAIGAVIGATIQFFEDLFGGGPPAATENDMRGAAEQWCFPSVRWGSPPGGTADDWPALAVAPGGYNRDPRAPTFWLLGTSPDAQPSNIAGTAPVNFDYAITWNKPPGRSASSPRQAWALAEVVVGENAVSRARVAGLRADAANAPDVVRGAIMGAVSALEARVRQARTAYETLVGGPTIAARHIDRVRVLYGANFDTTPPPSSFDGSDIPGEWSAFASAPQDFLYFPTYASWNGSVYTLADPLRATDVFVTVDTTLLGICELVVTDASDLTVLHWLLGQAWLWQRGKEYDRDANPAVDSSPLPNLLRCVGLAQRALRARERHARFSGERDARALRGASGARVAGDALKSLRPSQSTGIVVPVLAAFGIVWLVRRVTSAEPAAP